MCVYSKHFLSKACSCLFSVDNIYLDMVFACVFKNSFHESCILQIYGVNLKKNSQHESSKFKFYSGSY